MSSIVLTGGGTAGHCIPHLAILPYLNDGYDNICYIGLENGIEKRLMEKQTDYFSISTVKLRRDFSLSNFLVPFKLIKAVKEAKQILQKIKPSVIFSKGGYVALPVCLAGFSLKIPVVCHESDLTLGLTNKICAKKSDCVLTTFPETAEKIANSKYCGALIREQIFYSSRELALIKFGFDGKKPVILVFGGSMGSEKINNLIERILPRLLEKYYVLHICGNGHKSTYKPTFGYFRAEFVSDMASCYKVCDMAISRGGSGSIFELIATKTPALILPLKKGVSRGDQIQNADYFSRKGMCHKLYDEDLNEESLLNAIYRLDEKRRYIKDNINLGKQVIGNQKVSEILLSYI